MQAFKHVCREAAARIRLKPPAMDAIWEEGVAEDLDRAARVALDAGAAVADVYEAVNEARPEAEGFPAELERMLLTQGLHPDTEMASGHSLLLQKLYEVYPPQVQASVSGKGPVSLTELLHMGPDTAIMDFEGNTALHVLVKRTINKEYFADLGGHLIFHVSSPADLYNDGDRAAYLSDAFKAMIEVGYKANAADGSGKTVTQLLQEGYLRYTKAAKDTPCKGLRDMQRALSCCLKLAGEAVPNPPPAVPGAQALPGAQEPTWPYGRYKGAPIKDLDPGYVRWVCNNFDFGTPTKRPLLQQLVDAGKVREGPSGQLLPLCLDTRY